MPRSRQVLGALGLVVALASIAATARATVVLALDRAQLVEKSDRIVRAQVLRRESEWTEDHSQIVTLTELKVSAYVKGSGPQILILRQLGGQVGSLVARVIGDAELEPGRDVVLFLKSGDKGVVYLTALAQAAYFVRPGPKGETVERDLSGLGFARLTDGKTKVLEAPAETPEALTHFLADLGRLTRERP